MGSVFTCKLNPCCGDRYNCEPPRQYSEGYVDPPYTPTQPASPMAITDEQISEWCAQAQGKCFGVIPQARYVIEAALTAATAVAVPGVVELTEFAKEMCRVGFDGSDASGGEILEAAEQHGLVRCEAYDPAVHSGITNSEYLNPGDSIYVFAGPLAASPSAQGMAQETDGGSSNAL